MSRAGLGALVRRLPGPVAGLALGVAFGADLKAARLAAERLRALLAGRVGEEEARASQDAALAAIVETARRAPFYRERLPRGWAGGVERIGELPLLAREQVRERGRELLTGAVPRWKTFAFNTGGSTGEPLAFTLERRCGFVDGAHQRLLFEMAGWVEGDRVAACDGTAVPAGEVARGRYWVDRGGGELPYGRVHLSAHHLDDRTAGRYLEYLEEARPAFLRGYPSMIARLAQAWRERGGGPAAWLKGVILTAEEALAGQVEAIGAAFGCPVRGQYGHSEACVFGWTEAGGEAYRCAPWYGVTEVVDAAGRQVAEGEIGEVVVTGLHNRAMPLVRYRTGDLAVWGGRRGGLARLERLVGRAQDAIVDRRGARVPATGVIFGQHFASFGSIRAWQIVQREPGRVLVRVVPGAGFGAAEEREIRELIGGACDVEVAVERVAAIPAGARGKRPFVVGIGAGALSAGAAGAAGAADAGEGAAGAEGGAR